MATLITEECINCGACEPECPNTAIYEGGVEWEASAGSMHDAISEDIYYIVPEKVHGVRRPSSIRSSAPPYARSIAVSRIPIFRRPRKSCLIAPRCCIRTPTFPIPPPSRFRT